MINTTSEISNLLTESFLADDEIRQIPIEQSNDCVFLIEVEYNRSLEAWEMMRSLLPQTGRYPVLTYTWESSVDINNRFPYELEAYAGKIAETSPEAIISALNNTEIATYLERDQKASEEELVADIEPTIEWELGNTQEIYGCAPDRKIIEALVQRGMIKSLIDLEKWLFEWELQNVPGEQALRPPSIGYLDWFEPAKTIPLLLLPIQNGWETLAYLSWFGAESAGTPLAMQFLKQWHQQYGAELVCHYGTMLQFKVETLPTTPEAAFQLAWEQTAIAPCTNILPGISLRDHARALMVVDQWFLHERP